MSEKGKQDFNGTIDGAGYKQSFDNLDKPALTLVPPVFVEGIAKVLMKGAQKYARGNWMRGMSYSGVIDAMKRHIAAIERGEDLDDGPGGSGLPHIFHLGCEAAFYAHFTTGPRSDEYAQFDDRLYKSPARELCVCGDPSCGGQA